MNRHLSLSGLLASILALVLLFSSYSDGTSSEPLGSAFNGLSLLTLCFMLLCGCFGHSAQRTILLTLGMYAWGVVSLLVTDRMEPRFEVRWMLVLVGVCYCLWALFAVNWRDMELWTNDGYKSKSSN